LALAQDPVADVVDGVDRPCPLSGVRVPVPPGPVGGSVRGRLVTRQNTPSYQIEPASERLESYVLLLLRGMLVA